MDLPDGFGLRSAGCEQKLCWKLRKSLYGLKQSGRNWNAMLHSFLVAQKLSQSDSDHCVYTRNEGSLIVIVIIWVDDIIVASNSNCMIDSIKDSLKQAFKMKDLGRISHFLGIDFEFRDGAIRINQSKFIEKIIKRFDMLDCKPRILPCDLCVANLTSVSSSNLKCAKLYREIIGSLIYVMSCTRPDLCYVVSRLSQFMNQPTEAHLNIAKNVLRYLKFTADYSLTFRKSSTIELFGFCDSDWAASESRKSISGYCFKLSSESAMVSWKSKVQSSVALSSCEAEYVAMSVAIQEIMFLRQLLNDFNVEVSVVGLRVDSQSAIAVAKNPVHHQRCKHIDTKYHFIRQEVQSGNVSLIYVQSQDNLADPFTKPVARPKLAKFLLGAGLL